MEVSLLRRREMALWVGPLHSEPDEGQGLPGVSGGTSYLGICVRYWSI